MIPSDAFSLALGAEDPSGHAASPGPPEKLPDGEGSLGGRSRYQGRPFAVDKAFEAAHTRSYDPSVGAWQAEDAAPVRAN